MNKKYFMENLQKYQNRFYKNCIRRNRIFFLHNIEAFENTVLEVLSLRIGGEASDKLWRQIITDITGKIILLPSK